MKLALDQLRFQFVDDGGYPALVVGDDSTEEVHFFIAAKPMQAYRRVGGLCLELGVLQEKLAQLSDGRRPK